MEHTFCMTESAAPHANAVNETRFQFLRSDLINLQAPATQPAVATFSGHLRAAKRDDRGTRGLQPQTMN